ncbi:hypothetical protein K470DRAFT_22202 [Piedraia hortae CBS 480.64]|uniref:Uncharacterized protein n=1 Tax=Piedraia hortae CBS 480.64 TaxID=1314780 RepID=A0A6A7C4T7_9PEZI|nr:hypothetical protein K470DRAFT_22202 [Piedraia hortae CBS 480.64]
MCRRLSQLFSQKTIDTSDVCLKALLSRDTGAVTPTMNEGPDAVKARQTSTDHVRSPRSPDTASPVFPERAIRPLPKTRLKNRLSSKQASSIIYPPNPVVDPDPLLLSSDRKALLEKGRTALTGGHSNFEQALAGASGGSYGPDEDEDEASSEEEGRTINDAGYRAGALSLPSGTAAGSRCSMQGRLWDSPHRKKDIDLAPTSGGAVERYDNIEQKGNNKKRKIPQPSSGGGQNQLHDSMANLSLESPADTVDGSLGYSYAPGGSSSGTGISGAGRGRSGRQSVYGRNGERRRLGITPPGGSSSSRMAKASRSDREEAAGDSGIISQAIKNAHEQGPLTPQTKGTTKDAASLLQPAAVTSGPFTFSCESESATKLEQQEVAAAAAASARMQAQLQAASGYARPPPPPAGTPLGGSQVAARPKVKRRPSREYAHAARQRQMQQEYTNAHHRLSREDMWVCEFCEYESIFGEPPTALIRLYEIKDRRERQKAEERARLLEKAKSKSRKGKKASRKSGGQTAAPPSANEQNYDPNISNADDEYYGDENEESYGADYDNSVSPPYYGGTAGANLAPLPVTPAAI